MKIVEVARSMAAAPKQISDVTEGQASSNELFFKFGGKYKWSVISSPFDSALYFYPGKHSLEQLATMGDQEWEDFRGLVRYSGKDIGAEASEAFASLYNAVKNRQYDVDDVLDDILRMTGN